MGDAPVASSEDVVLNPLLCPDLDPPPALISGGLAAGQLAAAAAGCGPGGSLAGRYVTVALADEVPGAASARLCGVDVMGALPGGCGAWGFAGRGRCRCGCGWCASAFWACQPVGRVNRL